MWIQALQLFCVAAVVSLLLTPLVVKLSIRFGLTDLPNDRKIHTLPLPRIGGVCIFASVVVSVLFGIVMGYLNVSEALEKDLTWVVIGIGGTWIFFVGLWDDIHPIPASAKFLLQSIAALWAIGLGVTFDQISFLGDRGIELGLLAYPLTFLWIIGLTNAFNLIDGLDGLSAGLASIAAGTSAVVFFF